ncbi:FAD/NAD(P)-binding protein [Leeuwenhoekiella sp. W20_SRS_FM14]|uniref:FAD/NAD(P)-binding protein n=1 Tax=Leeuwenhoekiella sp. W20_SRS_FM14 TaxID=3240270 RepID=UPI003F95D99B
MAHSNFNIGIVGFGPKGFYGFERLIATLHEQPEIPEITIHLFNESEAFATGWVYDVRQPDYLLMNYPNQYISLKPFTNPAPILPICTFTEWRSKQTDNSEAFENTQIAPRKEVGLYLNYFFDELCRLSDSRITIKKHITKVENIEEKDSRFLLRTNGSPINNILFDALLITTGHSPAISSKLQSAKADESTIPFVYPFTEKLKHIRSQSTVAIKGIGLTAIDTILGLTEGRSGYFKQTNANQLTYFKSGLEPQTIFPFSRSGVPIIPRGEQTTRLKQTSFYLKEFVEKSKSNKHQFDFESEVLPIIKQDIVAAFYHSLFELNNFKFDAAIKYTQLEQVIENFHILHPELGKFTAEALLNPQLNSDKGQHLAAKNYWEFWIRENQKENSPFVAAAAAWRFLSEDFNYLYSRNRLTKASKTAFQQAYFGLFNRVSYGPPVSNIAKMIALADAGILDFSFSQSPSVDRMTKNATLSIPNKKIDIQHLVDARLPRGFSSNSSVIFNSNTSTNLFSFEKKSDNYNELKCTPEGYPIDSSGAAIKSIVLYGTPTEETLFDNDTLSRKHNDTATQWAKNTVAQLTKSNNCITI